MSAPPIVLELWIPSVSCGVRARVHGLDAARAALATARWPARDPGREASAELAISVVDEAVGLDPRAEFVGGSAEWTARLELTVSAGRASLERSGRRLVGEGSVRSANPLIGIGALVRAVTTAGLALRDVLVLHASAVRLGEDGVVFLGASGAGKTTTARRLGREGLRRIADDMIGIDLATWPPALHRLPFERHASSPAVEAARCVGGALVRKGASAPRIVPLSATARHWSDALVAFAPPPGEEPRILGLFSRLCRVPLATFEVPPAGRLIAPVEAWIHELAQGSAQEAPPSSSEPAPEALDAWERLRHSPRMESSGARGSGAQAIHRAPNVAWRVLDGAAVLVAPSSPTLHTLNAVGTKVWELADGRTVSEIVEGVVNEFEVARSQAETDVEAFVADMAAKGLLIVKTSEERR